MARPANTSRPPSAEPEVDAHDGDPDAHPGTFQGANAFLTALIAAAPVEVAEAAVEAADLWTALAALGLIVEPA